MPSPKCVVVGAGNISRSWFGPLKNQGVQITAVVEKRPEAAREKLREFQLDAEIRQDLPATLKKHRPDIVVDVTVPEARCQVVCTALEAGCHVVSEKPMAASMDEARRMVRTAEKTGRMFMVSQSRRWNGAHETIRRALAAKAVGTATTVHCDFFRAPHFGGFRDQMPSPLILDMAIHQFDMARMFTGADPVAVYAKELNPAGAWYAGDASASCIFEMSGGLVFTYCGSWCAEGFQTSWNGHWRIVGDRGTLLYEQDAPPVVQITETDAAGKRAPKDVPLPAAEMPHANQAGAIAEMLAFLQRGKTPQCECHDNIRSLAMVFAAIDSSRKGARVQVQAL